jgi:stage II sporulation protein P
MMVVGTDASGNHHPNWQKNLALGLKMTALLEQTDPGLTRPVNLRAQRFNMDLTPGSLLIEVGAAGNTHSEALLAAGALGRAILALAQGTR